MRHDALALRGEVITSLVEERVALVAHGANEVAMLHTEEQTRAWERTKPIASNGGMGEIAGA